MPSNLWFKRTPNIRMHQTGRGGPPLFWPSLVHLHLFTVCIASSPFRLVMRGVIPYCLNMFDEELKIIKPSVFWREAFIDLVNEFDASGEFWDSDESAKVRSDFSGFV